MASAVSLKVGTNGWLGKMHMGIVGGSTRGGGGRRQGACSAWPSVAGVQRSPGKSREGNVSHQGWSQLVNGLVSPTKEFGFYPKGDREL